MRADRLLSLLLLLQTRGRMTARELAERLEVSERTIYRDITALGIAGVPVYAERGPGGGCCLLDGYRTTLTGLSEAEVRTLLMSTVSRPLADLGLGPALDAALLKLLAALPSARRSEAERARQRLHVDTAGWGQGEEPVPQLRTVQEAVWQDRRLRIRYGSPRDISERVVDPYGLVVKAGIWYLVACSDGEMRMFRVSRIQQAELLDELFARPPDFDLVAHWIEACERFEASWGRYAATLRVAPEMLDHLAAHMREGERRALEQASEPDGEGWVTVTLNFDSFEAARSRALGLGTLVEVLEPLELRAAVSDSAAQLAAFYARSGVG
jgi:predicted DNA-binding transcriptional regulator YafY